MVLHDCGHIATADAVGRDINRQGYTTVERYFICSSRLARKPVGPSADFHANHPHLLDGMVHPVGQDNPLAHPNRKLAARRSDFLQIGFTERLTRQALQLSSISCLNFFALPNTTCAAAAVST